MSFQYVSEFYDDKRISGRVVDFLSPDKASRDKAIFFVHGGGYREGTRDGSYPGVIRTLNEMGYYCATVGYRRRESTIFDMIADVRAGFRCFLRFLEENGQGPKVAVFGTSAGAHLAGLMTLAEAGECGESIEEGRPEIHDWVQPIGLALQATPVTFDPRQHNVKEFVDLMPGLVGKTYEEAPEIYSKLTLMNYARPGACPVFMMEAELEDMFPYEMSMAFVRKLEGAGVRVETKLYKGAEHGFVYDVIRPIQMEAVKDIAAFVETL